MAARPLASLATHMAPDRDDLDSDLARPRQAPKDAAASSTAPGASTSREPRAVLPQALCLLHGAPVDHGTVGRAVCDDADRRKRVTTANPVPTSAVSASSARSARDGWWLAIIAATSTTSAAAWAPLVCSPPATASAWPLELQTREERDRQRRCGERRLRTRDRDVTRTCRLLQLEGVAHST